MIGASWDEGLHGVDRVGQQKPNLVKGMIESEEIIDFACGGGHTVAITKSSRVYGWGSNVNGQLGHAMRNCFPEAVEIPLGDPVAKVRAGWQCTVYITESARPIVCGGIRAEGPSVADMQKPAGEDGEAAPEMDMKGGGAAADAMGAGGVMGMVDSSGMEVMTDVVTEAAVGEAHGLLVCYDGSLRGWGYNRQAQAIGDFSEDTFVKPQFVDDMPEGHKAHSAAASGAQSYALFKPPGVY